MVQVENLLGNIKPVKVDHARERTVPRSRYKQGRERGIAKRNLHKFNRVPPQLDAFSIGRQGLLVGIDLLGVEVAEVSFGHKKINAGPKVFPPGG